MPWKPKDAARFTKKARGKPKAARAFAHASNQALQSGKSEGAAVRIGNFAAKQSTRKSRRSTRK
jgi:hypothetical protein